MPALLTRAYPAPSRAATSSTALSTEAALETSTFWKMPPPACASPSLTSQEATLQPSRAKRRAVARPIPLAPPVTMTTLSFNPVSITDVVLFSMLHCTHAKLLHASRSVGPAAGGRKESNRTARIRRRQLELQPGNIGRWYALCLGAGRPGPQNETVPRRFRERGQDVAGQYRNRTESRRHDVQRRRVGPGLPHRYGSIRADERGLRHVLPRPSPVAHHGGRDETRGGGSAHRDYGDGEEVGGFLSHK